MLNISNLNVAVRYVRPLAFIKSDVRYSKYFRRSRFFQNQDFNTKTTPTLYSTMFKPQSHRLGSAVLNQWSGKTIQRQLEPVTANQLRLSSDWNAFTTNNAAKRNGGGSGEVCVENLYRFNKQSSTFQPFLLALCGCLAYIMYSQKEDKRGEAGLNNSLLSYIQEMFTVTAAKSIVPDETASMPKSPPGKVIGRRERFNFIADVVEACQNSVVCIEVKDHSTVNWFGVPQASSNGSGFIVKEDGLILTNAHVVATRSQSSISVKLYDGRCFAGYIEEVDYESDLATLRINTRGLPTLPLGCSSETKIGEFVVAMGSPLNLSNTVTAGIVSSTRGASEIGIQANDINYIQTDAAITFGNSGGPLINLDGEAIGINSMKVMPGISFAIPIDHAKKFLERVELRRAAGKIKRGRRYMGLTILTLTEPIRIELEAKTGIKDLNNGVVVWQVVVGSPAYLAGVKPGDVITNINGTQIRSSSQVYDKINVDDKLFISIRRGEMTLTVTVVPEQINDNDPHQRL